MYIRNGGISQREREGSMARGIYDGEDHRV